MLPGHHSSISTAAIVLALFLTAVLSANQAWAQAHPGSANQSAIPRGMLPLTPFYDTPLPLPAGKPGDLIRAEPTDDYDLPMSATRILYHSLSATGEDVSASAVVLVPDKTPPRGGWPIIAWAHPFIATVRRCAPSLMRGLHSGPFLSMYAGLGYAIVAADYAGLGTASRNAYADAQSNATDIIYAVEASRKAVPQLGSKWIALGNVEGGTAAIALDELEAQMNDPGYLGSVAISGTLDLKASFAQLSPGSWHDSFAFLAYGIKTVFPSFQITDVLTPRAIPRYQEVTQSCPPPGAPFTVSADKSPKPGWEDNKFVQRFFERNTLGLRPARAPLLIISANDPKTVNSTAKAVFTRLCGEKDHIDFETYLGSDPNSLIGGSIATQMSWIQARFAGRMTPNSCP